MNKKYIVFTAMGFELVGLIVSSVLIGKEIDDKYHLQGLFLIVLSMLALAGWIFHIVALAKKLENKAENKKDS